MTLTSSSRPSSLPGGRRSEHLQSKHGTHVCHKVFFKQSKWGVNTRAWIWFKCKPHAERKNCCSRTTCTMRATSTVVCQSNWSILYAATPPNSRCLEIHPLVYLENSVFNFPCMPPNNAFSHGVALFLLEAGHKAVTTLILFNLHCRHLYPCTLAIWAATSSASDRPMYPHVPGTDRWYQWKRNGLQKLIRKE